MFFFPLGNLAESEAGNIQNLTGFKTDSLGRMADSEASNEGFYVHKFIKRYQFYSISLSGRYLLLLDIVLLVATIAKVPNISQFIQSSCLQESIRNLLTD